LYSQIIFLRYFIEIAYNGKNYHGWQIQPNAVSVQEVLERSLSTLLRKELKVTGAGRTDTGVHAKQLFAHFDADAIGDKAELIFRLNSFLPKDISVLNIYSVLPEAHARFDAVEREYQYFIGLSKDPFLNELVYEVHLEPDVEKMNSAAKTLLKYKDFQCFSRSKTDVKTYNCELKWAYWERKDDMLIFTISADRFLRNMVRAIVGTLLEVGYDKITLDEFQTIVESKDRSKAGASAPAHGLYLTSIKYPDSLFLEERI
jgi:tRNA pseudouridine38-40 synthase